MTAIFLRSETFNESINVDRRSATSGRRWPEIELFNLMRIEFRNSSSISDANSITRCSTRPVSVIKINIALMELSKTNSTWRTRDLTSDGY